MKELNAEYMARHPVWLAKDLIGKQISYQNQDNFLLSGLIVETEAYAEKDDPACHAYQGKKTKRNAVMFEKPGTIYVYLIYGIHYCMNVVCEEKDTGSAVLIRAVEPKDNIEIMQNHRPNCKKQAKLASGPGNLCKAFGFNLSHNGRLIGNEIKIYDLGLKPDIQKSERIGIRPEKEPKLWRFYDRNSIAVSGPALKNQNK